MQLLNLYMLFRPSPPPGTGAWLEKPDEFERAFGSERACNFRDNFVGAKVERSLKRISVKCVSICERQIAEIDYQKY